MKKIVALILALVMVMGLATVASAATTTTYNDKDVVMTTPAGVSTEYANDYDFVKYEKSTNTTTVDGKTVVTVTPVYFECAAWSSSKLVVVDKSLAQYILKIEDVGTFYIAEMATVPVVDAADVATVYVAPEEAACGVVGSLYQTFYVMNGKYYAAAVDGAKTALVGGEYVRMANTNTLPTAHDWAHATVKTWDTEDYATATSIECPECDAVINVYASVPGAFTGKTYVQITEGVAAGYYFVAGEVAADAAPSAPAGDKVESAETFDAGIAMYVGMSVLAATGSAVVLKKKD